MAVKARRHVVFATDRYWPAPGGLEVLCRRLAYALTERYRVTVMTLARDDGPVRWTPRLTRHPITWADDGPVRVATLGSGLRGAAPVIFNRLRALVSSGSEPYEDLRSTQLLESAKILFPTFLSGASDADIIHSFSPWLMSYLASSFHASTSIPHVITGFVHEGYWGDDQHSGALYRGSSAVVALSRAEAEVYGQLGVGRDRVHTIPVPGPANTAPDMGPISCSDSIVLFLGVKRPYKGYDVLLDAAPLVWQEMPDVRFWFIGPRTPESRSLFAMVSDARIIEVGEVSEDDRDAALAQCCVLCLPSATEIMPNVILEAWAMGKPVVATDTPTLSEMVDGAGLICERTPEAIAAALLVILRDEELRRTLGQAGLSLVRGRLSIATILGQLETLYGSLIS